MAAHARRASASSARLQWGAETAGRTLSLDVRLQSRSRGRRASARVSLRPPRARRRGSLEHLFRMAEVDTVLGARPRQQRDVQGGRKPLVRPADRGLRLAIRGHHGGGHVRQLGLVEALRDPLQPRG